MPGWGGRGEHGGLVQVREGNLEGRGAMGGIAGFDISVRRPPPYTGTGQLQFGRLTTVQRQRRYIAKRREPTRPPGARVLLFVCV